MTEIKTIIGLDAGASHSSLAVWENGQKVEERHDLPGANLDLIEQEETKAYFLMEMEKLQKWPEAYWVVGMAGLDSEKEVLEAEKWFRKVLENTLPYSGLTMMSDAELVLWAGSEKGTGIGLIAGTGSNCWGRNSRGKIRKTGGMSHLLADEGGGFSLGWRGLHLITQMADGRAEKTKLLEEVLRFYEVKEIADLKNYLLKQTAQKAVIAGCAPLILRAAERGETAAGRLVREESEELRRMVTTVREALEEDLPLFLAGSLFKNESYRNQLIINLHKHYPSQKIKLVSPVEGAVNCVVNLIHACPEFEHL